MSVNTGGPAFPTPNRMNPQGLVEYSEGMTLLDWYAGQEFIGDEDLMLPLCEHFAGPRPAGDWKANVVEWYEWEARWRAGVKYMRASAMLAEKARREATGKRDLQVEAVVQESSTTGHSGDANKMADGYIVDENNIRPEPQQRHPEQDHSFDAGKVAKLQAANRELVEALEKFLKAGIGFDTNPYIQAEAVNMARAAIAKHKGPA